MKRWSRIVISSVLFFLPAYLSASTGINKGDSAWIIVATALVMFMTPAGLALFYGGMIRKKNLLNTYALVFITYVIGSLIWMFWGYSLSFNGDIGGIIGTLKNAFLSGIGVNIVTGTIPTLLFAVFQMTFAAITIALVIGSVVERVSFLWWIVFSILWLTFVYSPVAHWVWGGGFLAKMGVIDFAGGIVVHTTAGITGLTLALLIGKRKNYPDEPFFPSSIVLTALGAALLWFGWFGFNAGSALAINGVAVNAFITTNTSGAIAAFTWMVLEWLKEGKPTLLGIASGAIAGLAGITPASGFVNFWGALIIGFFAAIFGFYAITWLKAKLKYDDSLDVFGVHGIDGMWGTLAAGLFADPAINGKAGLFYGNPSLFVKQLIGVVVVVIATIIGTVILAYIAKLIAGNWRVPEDVEVEGLDQAFHGERAFDI